MPHLLDLWSRAAAVPQGRRVFSAALVRRAPYTSTVKPLFIDLRPNYAELSIRKRRAVEDRLGALSPMALCAGLEAAAGALAEVSVRPGRRWALGGLDLAYADPVESDVRCVAESDPESWEGDDAEVPVRVRAVRTDGTVVVHGVLRLGVSAAPDPTP